MKPRLARTVGRFSHRVFDCGPAGPAGPACCSGQRGRGLSLCQCPNLTHLTVSIPEGADELGRFANESYDVAIDGGRSARLVRIGHPQDRGRWRSTGSHG